MQRETRHRQRWFGHVQRKEDDDWMYVEYAKPDGHSCKSRPKMTWMEVANKDLTEFGMCKADTQDRMR